MFALNDQHNFDFDLNVRNFRVQKFSRIGPLAKFFTFRGNSFSWIGQNGIFRGHLISRMIKYGICIYFHELKAHSRNSGKFLDAKISDIKVKAAWYMQHFTFFKCCTSKELRTVWRWLKKFHCAEQECWQCRPFVNKINT